MAIPALIVTAIAQIADLIMLHYDGDVDLIATIIGQPLEWIVRSPPSRQSVSR